MGRPRLRRLVVGRGAALFPARRRQPARRRRPAWRRRPAAGRRASRSPRPIAQAFVEACAENQIRRNDDFNGPEQEGAGLYPGDAVLGRRRERRALLGGRRLSASGDEPAEPDRHHRRAGHRRSSSTASAPPACAIARRQRRGRRAGVARGDPVRRRLRLAAAPAAVRHRPGGRTCAARHSASCTNCRVSARTCRTISISSLAGTSKDTDMIGIGLRGVPAGRRHMLRGGRMAPA